MTRGVLQRVVVVRLGPNGRKASRLAAGYAASHGFTLAQIMRFAFGFAGGSVQSVELRVHLVDGLLGNLRGIRRQIRRRGKLLRILAIRPNSDMVGRPRISSIAFAWE